MRAIIYYNDGSEVLIGGDDDELVPVYFSKKWLEAPADGVCQVDKVDERGVISLKEWEFYFQMPDNFHGKGNIGGSNKIGPFLRQSCMPYSLVKFGGWTSFENYQNVRKKSREYVRNNYFLNRNVVPENERVEEETDD